MTMILNQTKTCPRSAGGPRKAGGGTEIGGRMGVVIGGKRVGQKKKEGERQRKRERAFFGRQNGGKKKIICQTTNAQRIAREWVRHTA